MKCWSHYFSMHSCIFELQLFFRQVEPKRSGLNPDWAPQYFNTTHWVEAFILLILRKLTFVNSCVTDNSRGNETRSPWSKLQISFAFIWRAIFWNTLNNVHLKWSRYALFIPLTNEIEISVRCMVFNSQHTHTLPVYINKWRRRAYLQPYALWHCQWVWFA